MTDDPSAQAGAALPTQQATQFAMALNLNEVLLSVGQSRVSVQQLGVGSVQSVPFVEWIVTLSIAPQAAKQLAGLLQSGLDEYEKQFGPIPVDPRFAVQLNVTTTPAPVRK